MLQFLHTTATAGCGNHLITSQLQNSSQLLGIRSSLQVKIRLPDKIHSQRPALPCLLRQQQLKRPLRCTRIALGKAAQHTATVHRDDRKGQLFLTHNALQIVAYQAHSAAAFQKQHRRLLSLCHKILQRMHDIFFRAIDNSIIIRLRAADA